MAKKQKDKEVAKDEAVKPVAPGYRRVNLLTADHVFAESVDIPQEQFGPQIHVCGGVYFHVNDAADGTWQFCKAAK